MLAFSERGHKYTGLTSDLEAVRWISGTGFVHEFTQEFDALPMAIKVSTKKSSKWYGLRPNEIVNIWERESKRSTDIGSLYHAYMEAKYLSMDTMFLFGKELPVRAPIYSNEGNKIIWDQRMTDGVYPERLLYWKQTEDIGFCGQSDVVAVCDNVIHISDFKSNKNIKFENRWSKMKYPFDFLDDCNYNHYCVQISVYAWILLQNNPGMTLGEMKINHVSFSVESEDQYGFPRIAMKDGVPIVANRTRHNVTLYMDEVQEAINLLSRP